MLKNILGDWGSGLSDGDYACALAALGALESTGTEQHRPSSEPAALVPALEREFALGERTPVWREAQSVGPNTTTDSWRVSVHTDAAALAAAWRQYLTAINHPRQMPRLAVELDWRRRADLFDFDSLCAWLKHPDVALDALVLTESRMDYRRVYWHWPLRIGVPEGTEHAGILAALRMAQTQHSWGERLARCFTVGGARDACDLLILSPAAADQFLGESRVRVRASVVVCLDDPPLDVSHIGDRYGLLGERVQAAGVAAVGRFDDPSQQLGVWFNEMLREASHDLPIHGALWRARYWSFNREPLVLGNPEALDKCRILAIAERHDRVVAALESVRRVDLPSPIPSPSPEPTFGGPGAGTGGLEPPPDSAGGAGPPPGSAKPSLADELRERMFTSESVDGVLIADELEQRVKEIDQARAPRWIQANAWRGDEPRSAARSLAPRQWNLLGVHIGPTAVRRSDAAFPESQVDFSRGDVFVTVQLELAGAAVMSLEASGLPHYLAGAMRPSDMTAPGLAERLFRVLLARPVESAESSDGSPIVGLASTGIFLPPAGDSSLALFALCPQDTVTQVDGRIAIIHNNRVLQTARLSVGVGAAADAAAGLVVTAESTIHNPDDDLDERREYDVAIQVSDVGGKLHLTIQRGDEVTPVRLDDLDNSIVAIRNALKNSAENWDYSKSMQEQAVFQDCLYTLAAHGSGLEQHLRKMCGNDIDRWERIHLVPSTNEFLPLEYMYDGLPPKTTATVCSNVLGALEAGSCERAVEAASGAQPCPNQRDTSVVCPMHFWGFRRLIERNGTVRDPAPVPAPAPVDPMRSAPVCVPSRHPYGKVTAMLFAASDRAFLYATGPEAQAAERADLIKTLGDLLGTVSDASNWDQWREQAKKQPNLLVLVAHTDQFRNTPVLEIGDHKLLGRHEILADVSGAAGRPQLLILLGCSAAGVTENFQPYPERFRDAGVSIVLAPVAPIRGADAVPIAKRIAQLLASRLARPEPTSFGELLPILRRGLLREGHPGVMGIVGFGDGDWLLGG